MKKVRVKSPGADFEIVEEQPPKPVPGSVRVRVEACGVCHSDSFTVEGAFPIEWPRVPGHEAVGRIDMVGASTEEEGRPSRRRRLSWRQLRALWSLPRRG